MKLLRAQVHNFGSYDELNFDFNDQGLALVFGSTGAGKSTLLDVAPWCLFGQTAKNGKADDIRSWVNPELPTTGHLTVELQDGTITVSRRRSEKGNDLYYTEDSAPNVEVRGKDLTETQNLINKRLRVDFATYATAAYACASSPSETFFIDSAKSRRQLFEKITDLSLPSKLLERSQNEIKKLKKSLGEVQSLHDRRDGILETFGKSIDETISAITTFEKSRTKTIEKLHVLHQNFEKEKVSKIEALITKCEVWDKNKAKKLILLNNKIKDLDETPSMKRCGHCGENITPHKCIDSNEKKRLADERTIEETYKNPYTDLIQEATNLENHYEMQTAAKQDEVNPYEAQYNRLIKEQQLTSKEVADLKQKLYSIDHRLNAVDHLKDLSGDLRAALLQSSVSNIEHKVNSLLETYFEGAFRVGFTVTGDDLDISIQKSGYECTYLQLSKGQRRLLTLCFTVAMMEATSNNSGMHFDCLAFDEPTDGADADLKIAAYRIFEDLASKHSTVLVIEHDRGAQNQFDKKFAVTLNGEHSEINEVS